jgi:protein CpxP
MIRFRLIAAVAVIALAAGVVYAQGPRGGGPGGRGRGLFGGLPLRELQLSDAQQQQVKDIRSRHQADMRDAMSRLAAARQAQQKAVEAIPADESRIAALTQDKVQAEADVAIQASRLNSEIWSVLTPDQQTRLKTLRDQRQAQIEQRRQQFQQRRSQ